MQTIDRARRWLAIFAAALAGYVDAAGFLSTNRYFVSFMSGNTTRLGVDLATDPRAAIQPALLIGGFVFGVTGGAILAAKSGMLRKMAVLLLVASLLGGGALAASRNNTAAMLGFLVIAMGVLNNTFQRNGEVSVGLTYMTGALVRLGQGLAGRITGTGGSGWEAWLVLWLALALGAIAGATALLQWPDAALWVAAAWALVLALFARRLALS